jgi:hypothetical protein
MKITQKDAQKVLAFLYPDEQDMTREEVRQQLEDMGIDTTQAWKKVRAALEAKKWGL